MLFDRSGHRAVLTAAGTELLREGRHLLHAATELEARVKRIAAGVEPELHIAVSDLIAWSALYPSLQTFYAQSFGTRLRITTEVYGGCWDALVSGRADLALGAPNEGPAGGGYVTHPLGQVEFVFAIAPDHPLASYPEPLQTIDIVKFRAITAADSSRYLPTRSAGLFHGQDVLSVPNLEAKLIAHQSGLGVGYLPRKIALQEAAAGRLVIKSVTEPKPEIHLFMAWVSHHQGPALQWLVQHWMQQSIRLS